MLGDIQSTVVYTCNRLRVYKIYIDNLCNVNCLKCECALLPYGSQHVFLALYPGLCNCVGLDTRLMLSFTEASAHYMYVH